MGGCTCQQIFYLVSVDIAAGERDKVPSRPTAAERDELDCVLAEASLVRTGFRKLPTLHRQCLALSNGELFLLQAGRLSSSSF